MNEEEFSKITKGLCNVFKKEDAEVFASLIQTLLINSDLGIDSQLGILELVKFSTINHAKEKGIMKVTEKEVGLNDL